MKIIGLDFGTTNSTINYFNKESGKLDSFNSHAGIANYIPKYTRPSEQYEKGMYLTDPERYNELETALDCKKLRLSMLGEQ